MSFTWTCSHCEVAQELTDTAVRWHYADIEVGEFSEANGVERPALKIKLEITRCTYPKCKKLTVSLALWPAHFTDDDDDDGDIAHVIDNYLDGLFNGQVYPSRLGKAFPAHIPKEILQDYREAWGVIDISPKSSATLARRCLQAMIRDFCNIKERTLYDEIRKLEVLLKEDILPKGVDEETIEAMLALKDVGNIGAHMTERGGEILDVDPGEARALLGLIEMLLNDWYVTRGNRETRLIKIKEIAHDKKASGCSEALASKPHRDAHQKS